MERQVAILALALTLPLAMYGIPYAYAGTQSTYVVASASIAIPSGETNSINVQCSSISDFTEHFTVGTDFPGTSPIQVLQAQVLDSSGHLALAGATPNGWSVMIYNAFSYPSDFVVQIICQSPVTVAGIGVPEFGSLYFAVAIGAVVYFTVSRRYAGRRAGSGS